MPAFTPVNQLVQLNLPDLVGVDQRLRRNALADAQESRAQSSFDLQQQDRQRLNGLMSDPNSTPEQFARAGSPGIAQGILGAREQQTAMDAESAKRTALGAQYVINSASPKQMAEQQFPQFVADFEAHHGQGSWSTLDDNSVRAMAQGLLAHAGSAAGMAAPVRLQTQTRPDGSILQTDTSTGAIRQAVAPSPERYTAVQSVGADGQPAYRAFNARTGQFGASSAPAAAVPQGPPATGDASLASLPDAQQNIVKALADGRMQFPGGMAMKTPYWTHMLEAVSKYDPSFDTINFNSRSGTRKDFTSGKSAMNIKALNTGIGHLGTLASQIDGTVSTPLTPLNAVGNYVDQNVLGKAGPTNYNQTAGALASELTTIFRGSGGAEADVKRYLSELGPNASREQKQAAVQNITELLNSRLEAIGDQYTKGMGKSSDPLTLLDPKAAGVLQKLRGAPGAAAQTGASGSWGAPVASPSAHPPQIQALLSKYQ